MKNCQNCSAEMADNMNFCPSCRTKYVEVQPMETPVCNQGGVVAKLPLATSVNVALGLDSVFGFGSMVIYWFNSDNEDWIFYNSHNFLGLALTIIVFGVIPILLVGSIAITKQNMLWGKFNEITPKIWGPVISVFISSIIMASIVLNCYFQCAD